jgi:hypothetical protein
VCSSDLDQSSEFHSTETVNVANWRLISLVVAEDSFSQANFSNEWMVV